MVAATTASPVSEGSIKRDTLRIQALCREAASHAQRGDAARAARCYEEALGLARSLAGQRPAVLALHMGAVIWRGLSGELRKMELSMLTKLASCYLRGEAPDDPGSPEKAICMCEQALIIDPHCVEAVFCKGQALMKTGRPSEAEAMLLRAADLDPRSAPRVQQELESLGKPRARREGHHSVAHPSATQPIQLDLAGEWGAPLGFPSPLESLGIRAIEEIADRIATTLEQHGPAAYARELLRACQHAAELRYGTGASDRIVRLMPCARMIASQETLREYDPGKGQRYLNCCIPGLDPQRPFHEAAEHPWCAGLALQRGTVLGELRALEEHAGPQFWNSCDTGEHSLSPMGAEWRCIRMAKHGCWLSSVGFPETEAVFRSLRGARVNEVFLARMPPRTKILPHSDSTNFLLTAHVGLELERGLAALTVGECTREWSEGGVLVFDHSYVHSAANDSDRDRYVLGCRFWHPGCSDEEAYTLSFMSILLECLMRQGRVPNVAMLPNHFEHVATSD